MGQQQSSKRKIRKGKSFQHVRQNEDYVVAIGNPIFLYNEEENEAPLYAPRMPSQISPTLYISNAKGVMDIDRLKRLGITHVLNVGGFPAAYLPSEAYANAGLAYKLVDALDEPNYPMLDNHWNECYDFLMMSTKEEKEEVREIVEEVVQDKEQAQQEPSANNTVLKRKRKCCLVHCQAGSNRSALIVAAYYMVTSRATVLETVLHCRQCRGNAFLLNPGFQRQLVAFARRQRLLGPPPGDNNCVVDKTLWFKK